jgi:hypothetical protein
VADPFGPALLLEDRSDVPLLNPLRRSAYEYRSLLLAGDSDLVLLAAKRQPAFERYCESPWV